MLPEDLEAQAKHFGLGEPFATILRSAERRIKLLETRVYAVTPEAADKLIATMSKTKVTPLTHPGFIPAKEHGFHDDDVGSIGSNPQAVEAIPKKRK